MYLGIHHAMDVGGSQAQFARPRFQDNPVLTVDFLKALGHVQGIFSILKLDDRAIRLPHSHVIVDNQALEQFDETSLEVSRSRGLASCVNETLPSCHAVKEELLWLDARHEPKKWKGHIQESLKSQIRETSFETLLFHWWKCDTINT